MKRRSWIILAVCALLASGLGVAFLLAQKGVEPLTQEGAIDITRKIEAAFRRKNANDVFAYISPSPDTRISGLNQDQIHLMLVRYFRNSDRVSADMGNYVFTPGESDAALQFDVIVHNDGADSRKEDYSGRITLHLRRVEVPHLLGLYQTKEWRISAVQMTGADLSTFGDY